MRILTYDGYTVCRDCTRRVVGCHAECADYKAFAKSREEVREIKRIAGSAHYKFAYADKKK